MYFKKSGILQLSRPVLFAFFGLALITQRIAWSSETGISYSPAPLAFSNPKTHWYAVCDAARQMTPKNAKVLNPPYKQGFVYFSKRISFVEFKYGANFSNAYAEWDKRLRLAARGMKRSDCDHTACLQVLKKYYDQLTAEDVLRIAREYGLTYFITESKNAYPFRLLYQNSHFKLYELPSITGAETDNPDRLRLS